MSTVVVLLIGAAAGVVLSALASGIETGSYCLNRVRLRVRADQGQPAARRLATLVKRQEDVILTTLLGTTLADYICTACITALLMDAMVTPGHAQFWTVLLVTPLLLVFGGMIPKDWFRREADRLMYALALPLVWGVRAARATGFLWLMRRLTRALAARIHPSRPSDEAHTLPRASVLRLLHEGAALGGLSRFQRDLIDRVMNLSNLRVAGVMIPRPRVAAVSQHIRREDFLRVARMAHFSRMPVYRGDPRNVVGIVSVFDVLSDRQVRPVVEYVRPHLGLPAHTSVAAALLTLQRRRETMAVVEDRGGQCIGILTLKDLVEEIVGDLEAW
jgi:CBS domain containing-hemolysin-like protein